MYLFQIWTAFRVFDKNGDGMVTKAEFRSVSSNSQYIPRTALLVRPCPTFVLYLTCTHTHLVCKHAYKTFLGGKKEYLGGDEKFLRG